jgi:CDGSH-type Zn-finger protein
MARMIRLDAREPVKVGPSEKPISICACGLSRTFPICDGTHKTTARLESPDHLYFYDPQSKAVIRSEAMEGAAGRPGDPSPP